MRSAKARLCVYGAVYRRYAVHRLDHRPCRPPARPPERTRRKVHPCQRGRGALPIWNCARISAPPCGGSMPSSSCPRPRRNCCAPHGRRRAGHFPAHKAKTKPGTLSGPDGSQKGPGIFTLRCGPQPMGRAHKCRRRILCRETERPCRFARQGLSAFQGCFRITSGGSALPAGRSMP